MFRKINLSELDEIVPRKKIRNAEQVLQFFKSRGYLDKQLQRLLEEVKNIPCKELLGENEKKSVQNPNSILIYMAPETFDSSINFKEKLRHLRK